MRYDLNNAELAFFDHLSTGAEKIAVELEPATRSLLGIPPDETPDALDQLESAASGDTPEPAQAPASPPQASQNVQGGSGADQVIDQGEQEAHVISEEGRPPELDGEPQADEEDEPLPVPEGVPGRATHGKIFNARRTHPMLLKDVLDRRYGDDWLFWEPETLWWAIRRDFGAVGEITRNKLQAIRTATKSYTPWDDWDTFENCCVAWSDGIPIFGAMQPLTPSQMAFGVQILKQLHPEAPWGHEVAAYEAMVLEESGFVYAPEELFPSAQALINRKDWIVELRDQVDSSWRKLQTMDLSGVDWNADNPVDIHIAKLLVIKTYLEERELMRTGPASVGQIVASATPVSLPVQ